MIVNDIVHVAAESSDMLHNTDTHNQFYMEYFTNLKQYIWIMVNMALNIYKTL